MELTKHQGNKYSEKKSLVGEKIGRWQVLLRAPNKDHLIQYWCQCDCGFLKRVDKRALVAGRSKSCGCLKNEMNSKRLKEAWKRGSHSNGRLTSLSANSP